jgi:hypothetical protein
LLREVPGTLWLIDVDNHSLTTLYGDSARNAPFAAFDETTSTLVFEILEDDDTQTAIRTSLDGAVLERRRHAGAFELLPQKPSIERSPNQRWRLYQIASRDLPQGGNAADLWVEDLVNGERRELVSGLETCSPCDAETKIAWSPDGDHLYIAEASLRSKVFLIDVPRGVVRDITTDVAVREPDWSPTADLLLRPSEAGTTILEDVRTGAARELVSLPWPARFDPSGSYIYSLTSKTETVVADQSGNVVARLGGSVSLDALLRRERPLPETRFGSSHPLVKAQSSFFAAASGVAGCAGTMLFVGAVPRTCVVAAGMPVFSPDGSRVVLARKTGDTGPVDAPMIQAVNMDVYELLLIDVASGRETVLARGALGFELPPQVVWNESGTHILVRWPFDYGP